MSHMKEREVNKLLDMEFKTMVRGLLRDLNETFRGINESIKGLSETFQDLSENVKDMKKDQSEIKHTLTEIKNNFQGFDSRGEDSDNQTNNLEYEEAKNTQSEEQKEKSTPKYEDNIRSLWDNFKCTNIHVMGVPEGGEREQDIENLFVEIMTVPVWGQHPRGGVETGMGVMRAT
uniref:Uncharacterized protein n=1 Tax=Myotis myotis TaxID=51298 RepID=A0A7J7WI32_MYOMY|nr:hypothetical protein mMyoMyo1_012168 [Myotis myotis]